MDYQPTPSDSAGEFSQAPFIAAGLYGRRAFRIERRLMDGQWGTHMTGPVYDFPWTTDGINIASCQSNYSRHWLLSGKAKPPEPVHRIASEDCGCGFWSYWAEMPETMTYRNSVRNGFGVEGIIFGFGNAYAGTKGFRCEKARIMALVVPDQCDDLDLLEEAMDKFAIRWYGTIDAAIERWPLSKATKYGIEPYQPPEPEAA